MTDDDRRLALHEAIAANPPWGGEAADTPDGGVVTAWMLVVEWEGTDGNRWLSKMSGNASGDRELPAWTVRGLAHEVATVPWPGEGDDE